MADPIELKLPTRRRAQWGRLTAFGVLAAGALISSWMFSQSVPADAVGVRQVYFGPGRGVQEDPLYGPGLHLVLPGYERLHVFPRDMQTMDFNDAESEFAKSKIGNDYHWVPSIRIQTSEGYQVSVDVTLLYRVVDPAKVLREVGPGRLFETQVVQARAEKTLRQYLGELDAEDFYDDALRMAKVEKAREALTTELSAWGLQVWSVLLREYSYDQRYQVAIENRKIQDQRVFKNQAESVAASRAAERDRVLASGQARILVEKQRGDAEVTRIQAEADLYYRQKVAEGDLLVALAEARGTELENRAFQAVGAGNIVGLEMAKALEGTKVIILSTTGASGVNPLDLDQLIEGF
ncbi:MAG TPA: SPFH domain-containing protein [Myxococcota bacterium]|nr:SPFH domain-containing protein [Myxococcota bacterium]